jgi:hypothetical protein
LEKFSSRRFISPISKRAFPRIIGLNDIQASMLASENTDVLGIDILLLPARYHLLAEFIVTDSAKKVHLVTVNATLLNGEGRVVYVTAVGEAIVCEIFFYEISV